MAMIVSNKPAIQRVAQIYQENRRTERVRKRSDKPVYSDEVTLSSQGREMQVMLQKLQTAPDIRPRAEEIKVAVENGTYQVSPRQIAQAIINAQKGS